MNRSSARTLDCELGCERGLLLSPDKSWIVRRSGAIAFRRTGLSQFVLDFALVSGSESRAFETHLENAKKRTSRLRSMGFSAWQAMAQNGLKWPKVDF